MITEAADVVDGAMLIASTLSTSTGSIVVDTPTAAFIGSTTTGNPVASEGINTAAMATLTVASGDPLSDDVSDSADSEYRSLETKDDDSDLLNYCTE